MLKSAGSIDSAAVIILDRRCPVILLLAPISVVTAFSTVFHSLISHSALIIINSSG